MSAQERQQQFEAAVRARPGISADARIARNFGFSNSARIIEGGLFACTNNQGGYARRIVAGTEVASPQFVFLCVLTFPPQDEVYFAIVVSAEAARMTAGLVKLLNEGNARNAAAQAAFEEEQRQHAAALAAGQTQAAPVRRAQENVNNNVKFYITADGRVYFHNTDFKDTLLPGDGRPPLDEDCMARVDEVLFAIYPPSVSARRSLLARDFVGYLGGLVGRDRVHELRVWNDAEALSASMRRLPPAIPVAEIEAAIAALGGHYPNGEVRRFHAALNFLTHKHFVILAGLSGTGKTQLALKYARAVHGLNNDAPDPLLFVCPVRPEWTDPTGLTGYNNVLTNRYEVPTFLAAVLIATAHRDSPVFVVLDEMNLARVEYYLSDVLSAIETGSPLQLHSSDMPLEGTTGTGVRRELPLPPNLFLIGTINIDETTNPVSDKVLDRASVIDMSSVDVPGFLASLAARFPELAAARTVSEPKLTELHRLLSPHGMGFGYRVIEEYVRYHAFDATHLHSTADEVTDQLLVQKVLVKLRGSMRHRTLLTAVQQACAGLPRSLAFVGRLVSDLDEFGSFQAMR